MRAAASPARFFALGKELQAFLPEYFSKHGTKSISQHAKH